MSFFVGRNGNAGEGSIFCTKDFQKELLIGQVLSEPFAVFLTKKLSSGGGLSLREL